MIPIETYIQEAGIENPERYLFRNMSLIEELDVPRLGDDEVGRILRLHLRADE